MESKKSASQLKNSYGFTGESQFGEADDLIFLRARYYSPSIGRFISRDPILLPMRIGNNFFWFLPHLIDYPQNLYSYVYSANNPVNKLDPSGLGFWSCVKNSLEGAGLDITLTSLVLWTSCVAGCTGVTGGVAAGPCLIGCTAATFGGQAVGLALACIFVPPPCP